MATETSCNCSRNKPGLLPVLIWAALLISAMGALLLAGRWQTDITLFLPESSQPVDRLLLRQLQEGPASQLILLAIEDAPAAELARLSDALADALRASPHFTAVMNGRNRIGEKEQKLIAKYRYLLGPEAASDRFTVAGLTRALRDRLRGFYSSAGMLEKRLLTIDPTGEFARLADVFGRESGPPRREGVWFAENGERALLMVRTAFPVYSLDDQEAGLTFIRRTFQGVTKRPGQGRLLMSGPPVFAVQARDAIRGEVFSLTLIASAGVLIFLLWLFRSLKALLLVLLPLASGILAGGLAVNLAFGFVHGITISFGIILIGVAIDYPIHWIIHSGRGESQESAFRIWPTLRLGFISSCLGFVPMLGSRFPGLNQLGLFAAVGLAAAAYATRWVVPFFIARFHLARVHREAGGVERIFSALRRLSWLPLGVLVGGAVFISLQDRPLWEFDLARLSPVPEELKRQDRTLRGQLGAPEIRKVVVILADSPEEALQKSEALLPALDERVRQKRLEGFELAARFLPSQATQRKRREALPPPEALRRNFQAVLQGFPLPLKEDAFQPFIDAVQTSRTLPPLTLADLKDTALGWRMEPLLFEHQGRWVALATLRGAEKLDSLWPAASMGGKDVHLIDLKERAESIVLQYMNETLRWLSVGAVLIWLTLCAGLRDWRAATRALIPVAASVMMVTLYIFVSEGGLSLFHLVSILLVIGIGVDYALFFQRHFRRPEERSRTAGALMACGTTTLFAFSALILSQTSVLKSIGMTVTIGVLFSILFGGISARNFDSAPKIRNVRGGV